MVMKASAVLNDKDGWAAEGRCRREEREWVNSNEINQLMKSIKLFWLVEWVD